MLLHLFSFFGLVRLDRLCYVQVDLELVEALNQILKVIRYVSSSFFFFSLVGTKFSSQSTKYFLSPIERQKGFGGNAKAVVLRIYNFRKCSIRR